MKLRLILAFMALTLAACSGDDDTTNPPAEKNIKEISGYSDNGNQLDEMIRFENNRMTERDLYDQGEVFYEDRYTYDDQGRLILRTVSNLNDGDMATIELQYDGTGRMTNQQLEMTGYSQLTTYSYDESGKIEATVVTYSGGVTYVDYWTYNLDAEGYVSSIISGNNATIIAYEGNNVVARTRIDNAGLENEEITRTDVYDYDMDTQVKGPILVKDFIRFGDNNANYELYNGYDYQPARDRFILSSTTTTPDYAGTTTMEYEFDNDEFPIQITTFEAGEEFFRSYIAYA